MSVGGWFICTWQDQVHSVTAFPCLEHSRGHLPWSGLVTAACDTHWVQLKHLHSSEAFQKGILVNQSVLSLGYKEGNPYQRREKKISFMATIEDHPWFCSFSTEASKIRHLTGGALLLWNMFRLRAVISKSSCLQRQILTASRQHWVLAFLPPLESLKLGTVPASFLGMPHLEPLVL